MNLQEQAAQSDSVKCGSCSETGSSEVVAFCYNCKEFLCLDCTRSHKNMKTLQHHNYMSIEDLKCLKSPGGVEKPGFCREHPEKKVKLFCLTCQLLTYKDCALVKHKEHHYNFIDTVADNERKDLTAALDSLEVNLKTVTNKIIVATEERKRLHAQSELDVSKLKDSVEQAITRLTARKEALEEDIKRNFQATVQPIKVYEQSLRDIEEQMKECLRFGKDLVQQPSNHEILGMKLPVMLRVTELNASYQKYLHSQPLPQQPSHPTQNLKLPDNDMIKKLC